MAENTAPAARVPASLDATYIDGSPTPLPKRDSIATNERTRIGALTPVKSSDMALNDPQPRCLFFDVFGTCVDWRKTVTDELWAQAREALNSPSSSIASRIRFLASDMVGRFMI